MKDIVIKIENLTKKYRLGAIGGGTLSQDLNSWWARIRKKEDPNSRIGSKYYGKNDSFTALEDFNLEVHKGDVLGIIGANGAGKSTLLKILSRVTSPTSGQAFIRGRIASLLEVGTGFHPEMTGRENIYLNGSILGMTKQEINKKIEDIIEFSEIRKFIDTPVKRYSSGMYVRLAFAVAAHLDAEILIVDEVLAVGDYQFQQKCLGKMSGIKDSGRTILFVSHQLSMIKALCNKCALLENGKLVMVGRTDDVINQYTQINKSCDLVSFMSFEDDKEKEYAQVSRVCLKNKQNEVDSVFEIFDEINLEIEYIIKKPLIGVAVSFLLYKNSVPQCMSFDTDIDSQLLEKREPGRFITKVTLPPVLKAGFYFLDLGICKPGLDGIDGKKNVLSFLIQEETINSSMCSYSMKRIGDFAARLKWNSEKLQNK